ncbi:MAG: phenylacetate--CoA ligase family protein, partial [Candidatus Helarchaeota archaeon]
VTHGLFTGGLGYFQGATRLGCLYIPFGGGNTARQLEFMIDYGVTAIHGIPSFGLRLVEVAEEMNLKVPLRLAMLGAELWSNSVRKKIEEGLECEAYDNYGLTELIGPGVSCECPESKGDSLHVWSDNFIAEIIDPATGERLEFGEEGELVLTNLTKEAMPAIRYRTRDLTSLEEECACGRNAHVRMKRIKSRLDDMLKIRGVNVFPSQIEYVIMKHKEIGYNYRIRLWKRGALDEITVEAEVKNEVFRDLKTEAEIVDKMQLLKNKIAEELRNLILLRINVELKPEGAIPRSQGKAKRIFDER